MHCYRITTRFTLNLCFYTIVQIWSLWLFGVVCNVFPRFQKLVNVWLLGPLLPIMFIFVMSFKKFGLGSLLFFSKFSFLDRYSMLYWSFELSYLLSLVYQEQKNGVYVTLSSLKLVLRFLNFFPHCFLSLFFLGFC